MKKESITIPIRREPDGEGMSLPRYMTEHAAGMDLLAACADQVVLKPGERRAISAGISIALPQGYEAQVRPRSGLAARHGVTVLNAPGLIDSGYRGELKVLLINHGAEAVGIERGERIAQLVVQPVAHARLVEGEPLPDSARGEGGFGSTGR